MMQQVLLFIIIVVLLMVVVEDFRSRTVHAFWFPVLLVLGFFYSIQHISIEETFGFTVINLAFLLLQGVLLIAYFVLKHRQWIDITQIYLGWGDILFMVAVLPLFSPLTFILFYLSSLLLTILFVIVYRLTGRQMVFIPLAGIQAFFLLMSLVYHQFVHAVMFKDIYWPLVL